MAHNASRVLLGSTQSVVKEVTNHIGSIAAGYAVHLSSLDAISLAASDGALLGISLGTDLSDSGRTAICRKGLRVPVRIASGFTPAIGGHVAISDTTGEAVAYTGSGNAYVNAVYVTSRIGTLNTGGIAEGATSGETGTVGVALIDFPGGL